MKNKEIVTVLISLVVLASTACGRQAEVVSTWFSIDDYSFNIEIGEGGPELELSPTLRVMPKADEFKGTLKLILRYPKAEERLDVMVVDIFSKNKPKVDLPKIKVKVSYLMLDDLLEDHNFDAPEIAESNWKKLQTYNLKPGQEKTLKIPGAASHKLVIIRSEIYDAAGEELLSRYLHGFELE